MRWFGPNNDPPFHIDDLERMPIPVGHKCDQCEEAITGTEFGVELPLIGNPLRNTVLYHYECHARQVIGSVSHLERKCKCFVPGSECGDPSGMTRREGAKAALELFIRRSHH